MDEYENEYSSYNAAPQFDRKKKSGGFQSMGKTSHFHAL